jgi:UDP-glucose:(heptosyl)LPS alpha-1,3-glucosyltransferase
MKVALAFPGCHRRGGVERIIFECARFLALRGHDTNVFAAEWEPDETAPVRYHSVPMLRQPRFLQGQSFYRNCRQLLATFDHDVLNTHGVVCPPGGVHWVQSLHVAWLDRCRQFRRPFSKAWALQRLNPLHPILLRLEAEHFRSRRYAKIIATTAHVRDDLARYYGVPESDVVIIPNGFSATEFNPQRRAELRPQMRARLGLRGDDIALLFVANELERKGYDTILSALRILGRKDLRLLVVGRPPVGEVRRRAEAAGVGESVIACGPTSTVGNFHAAADLFVLPPSTKRSAWRYWRHWAAGCRWSPRRPRALAMRSSPTSTDN